MRAALQPSFPFLAICICPHWIVTHACPIAAFKPRYLYHFNKPTRPHEYHLNGKRLQRVSLPTADAAKTRAYSCYSRPQRRESEPMTPSDNTAIVRGTRWQYVSACAIETKRALIISALAAKIRGRLSKITEEALTPDYRLQKSMLGRGDSVWAFFFPP